MRITKVKSKGDKISIAYQERGISGVWDDYQLRCSDRAKPEFYQALKQLAVEVVAWAEMPKEWVKGLEVRSVTYGYCGEDDIMSATVTATKELDSSDKPLIVHTPQKLSEPYTPTADAAVCLPPACVKKLNVLMAEAENYINGEREQMDLPGTDEDTKKKK